MPVVAITGCGRGLGRAITRRFVERDWTVAGCTFSPDSAASLSEEFSSPHRFAQIDVSDDRAVAEWVDDVASTLGPPQMLLNNAARMNANASLWEVPPDDFRSVMETNVVGMYYVLRHWIPRMIDASEGIIVNFSSTWGRTTSPEVAPYCASKFAVEGMTQALAKELPRELTAVALNPGVIDTDMLRSCFGNAAGVYRDAEAWSHEAIEFLLELSRKDNGMSLSVE